MRAVSRLINATGDFDDSWRAHAVALRSTILVKSVSAGGGSLLKAALSMSKGFEAGFDADFALEHLLEEIEYLQDSDFFALRKNCLLGVCSSFEDFAKTYAAALSYEPKWKTLPEGARLLQATDSDFHDKYLEADKEWKKGYEKFLNNQFPWLTTEYGKFVAEIFWLRNQLTHNANKAKDDKTLVICNARVSKGKQISLDSERLRLCIQCLREVVRLISDGTPYLEAI